MKEARAIQFVGDAEGSRIPPRVGFVRLGIDLPVFDETLRIVADVPDQRLRMSDMVPLAYQICDRVVAAQRRVYEVTTELLIDELETAGTAAVINPHDA